MAWGDLFAALALVLVIEGLLLAVAPRAWKDMARRLVEEPDRRLQAIGAALVVAGLLALGLVRAG